MSLAVVERELGVTSIPRQPRSLARRGQTRTGLEHSSYKRLPLKKPCAVFACCANAPPRVTANARAARHMLATLLIRVVRSFPMVRLVRRVDQRSILRGTAEDIRARARNAMSGGRGGQGGARCVVNLANHSSCCLARFICSR